MNVNYTKAEKPNNWPINMAEQSLECIALALDDFCKTPGYVTRESLLSLIDEYDLNQRGFLGEYRVDRYEVSKINEIYYRSLMVLMPSVRCYLYGFVGERARLHKMMVYMMRDEGEQEESLGIGCYENGLCLPLRLYYQAYHIYNVEKDKPFADKITELVEGIAAAILSAKEISGQDRYENLFELSRSYSLMLNDLSYFHGNKKENIWKFSREDLLKLFTLEAKLIKKLSQNPAKRPIRGVLMTQISNFILKSRHDYNQDYICKYVSEEVAEASCQNHEIWMNKIENLNDEREGRVLKELFDEDGWISSSWVQKPDLTPVRKYFVSSFSKSLQDNEMKQGYGAVVFGCKNDRIADLLSPVYEYKGTQTEKYCFCSQVMAYDVLYDREEAKEELNYLFKVIELFAMTDSEKNEFLQSILQYWLLSVKDSKWSHERERRYVLFLYDDYQYREMEIEDDFLKLKTSLFLVPDFVMGNHRRRSDIREQVDAKRRSLSYRNYLFCHDCLNRDYDAVAGLDHAEKCPVCGSENIEIVEPL